MPLGNDPLKNDRYFVYTSYEYDDNDELVSEVNAQNASACENEDNFNLDDLDGCGLDGDKCELKLTFLY